MGCTKWDAWNGRYAVFWGLGDLEMGSNVEGVCLSVEYLLFIRLLERWEDTWLLSWIMMLSLWATINWQVIYQSMSFFINIARVWVLIGEFRPSGVYLYGEQFILVLEYYHLWSNEINMTEFILKIFFSFEKWDHVAAFNRNAQTTSF